MDHIIYTQTHTISSSRVHHRGSWHTLWSAHPLPWLDNVIHPNPTNALPTIPYGIVSTHLHSNSTALSNMVWNGRTGGGVCVCVWVVVGCDAHKPNHYLRDTIYEVLIENHLSCQQLFIVHFVNPDGLDLMTTNVCIIAFRARHPPVRVRKCKARDTHNRRWQYDRHLIYENDLYTEFNVISLLTK